MIALLYFLSLFLFLIDVLIRSEAAAVIHTHDEGEPCTPGCGPRRSRQT